MFLVEKKPTGWRAIADLRACNKNFLPPAPFTHPRIHHAFDPERRWATKLDISSAFYKFAVHRDLQPHFVFADADGRPLTYQGLPMGWAWSPLLMDAALGCLDAVWAAHGLTIVRYADDLLLLGRDAADVQRTLYHVLSDLTRLGLHAAPGKTYPGAYQCIDFLGWTLDLENATAQWEENKAIKLREAVRDALRRPTTRELQRIVGKLVFLTEFAPALRACYRGICEEIAARDAADRDPYAPGKTTVGATRDLLFWNTNVQRLAQHRFRDPTPRPGTRCIQADVDASAVGVGIVIRERDEPKITASFELTDADVSAASGVRELEAIRRAVQHVVETQAGNSEPIDLDIRTDAQVANHVMTRGSARAPQMTEKMSAIAKIILDAPWLVVRTTWIPREENIEADAASRAVGSEAGIDHDALLQLMHWATGRRAPPDVDLFATRANTRGRMYFSRVPDEEACGNDGLDPWPWPNDARTWLAYPPFSIAARAATTLLEQLRAANKPGLMLLPWSRASSTILQATARDDAAAVHSADIIPPPGADEKWTCLETIVAIRVRGYDTAEQPTSSTTT